MQLEYDMSPSEARLLYDVLDQEEWEPLTAILDQAQGAVSSGNAESSTITITIKGE